MMATYLPKNVMNEKIFEFQKIMNKIGQPIRLHPQWLQFIASEGFIIPIPIALIFIAGYDGFPFTQLIPLLMGLSGIFIIGLIYQYFYITKMMYVITDEQIQSEHGLFSVQRNYVELYRVIDYREDQSFIQMILVSRPSPYTVEIVPIHN